MGFKHIIDNVEVDVKVTVKSPVTSVVKSNTCNCGAVIKLNGMGDCIYCGTNHKVVKPPKLAIKRGKPNVIATPEKIKPVLHMSLGAFISWFAFGVAAIIILSGIIGDLPDTIPVVSDDPRPIYHPMLDGPIKTDNRRFGSEADRIKYEDWRKRIEEGSDK